MESCKGRQWDNGDCCECLQPVYAAGWCRWHFDHRCEQLRKKMAELGAVAAELEDLEAAAPEGAD